MTKHLFIGGLVAAGFDPSGQYLLTVSHSGRGVFSTATWERVARDPGLAYPSGGFAYGIGPIDALSIPVTEIDYDTGLLRFSSPDGSNSFEYESGTLTITNERA
jgi:hypothetical protein